MTGRTILMMGIWLSGMDQVTQKIEIITESILRYPLLILMVMETVIL